MKSIVIALTLALLVAAPAAAHNSPCPNRQREVATLHAEVVGSTITQTLTYTKRFRSATIDYTVAQWEGGQLVLIFRGSTPTTSTVIVNGTAYPAPATWDTYQDFHDAVFCS